MHAFALLVMIVISPLLGRKQTLPILLILFTATWPMIAGGWLLRAVRTILERLHRRNLASARESIPLAQQSTSKEL